jgi:hypothetical protein
MQNARSKRIDDIVRAAGSRGLSTGVALGIGGSFTVCLAGTTVAEHAPALSGFITLVAMASLVVAPFLGRFVMKRRARERELAAMSPQAYEARVLALVEAAKAGDVAGLASTLAHAEGAFRARGGERVLWAGPATSTHESTELTGLNTVGVSRSVGSKWAVGASKSVATHGRVMHSGGAGVVVVTDDKLVFVSRGSQDNLKTGWDDVVNWQPAGLFGLLLQTTGQAPRTFQLAGAGFDPEQDHRVMAAVIDAAAG